MEIKPHRHDLKMEKKSFWLSVAFLFLVMVTAYVLTMVLPGGVYSKIDDGNGNQVIDTAAGFTPVQGGIPFWKWLLSPLLVLTGRGAGTLIPIILFLLLLGGVFSALITQGILSHMLAKLVRRFAGVRYRLMAAMIFFFMALGAAGGMSRPAVILFIYLICMATNFFVPSGSAEALLLIPIIVPLAGAFGISAQLCIVAFAFGDGFSNILYPTNPALMVALGLADCGYGKWIRYSLPFQLINLVLTCGLLLLGLAVGYA